MMLRVAQPVDSIQNLHGEERTRRVAVEPPDLEALAGHPPAQMASAVSEYVTLNGEQPRSNSHERYPSTDGRRGPGFLRVPGIIDLPSAQALRTSEVTRRELKLCLSRAAAHYWIRERMQQSGGGHQNAGRRPGQSRVAIEAA